MNNPQKMGVYRFFDADEDISFVGYSFNLNGARKRLKYELTLNACFNKQLQELYNKHNGLECEVLEEYIPAENESNIEIDAHLQALAFKYKGIYNAKTIQFSV